jgi:hypothetical protein
VPKHTIVRLFLASVVAAVAATVLLLVVGGLAVANDVFVMRGPDVVGVRPGTVGWVMVALAVIAFLVLVGATIAQFVAWLGAVLNTSRLEDKTWFVILLVTGLLSFGFIAMIVYAVAGPDGVPSVPDGRDGESWAVGRLGEAHSGTAPPAR